MKRSESHAQSYLARNLARTGWTASLPPIASLVIVCVALLLGGCFHTERDWTFPKIYAPSPEAASNPSAPKDLHPPAGNNATIVFVGAGTQNYECKTTANGVAWVLAGPEAHLYNQDHKIVGRHYVGPTWEYQDGSKISASVIAHVASPNPASVDQLLLRVLPHDPVGLFANVTFVQRLRTFGGVAPASGCSADHLGDHVSVEYSADYVFFTPA